jgi:hypothetical protein
MEDPMTDRSRRLLVAGGLVILIIWVLLAWYGSAATPEPSRGPSPTGAIGSAPITFAPTDATEAPSTSP